MTKTKVIWFVNYYAETPQNCSNPRYIEFAYRLKKDGFRPIQVISASENHDKSEIKLLDGLEYYIIPRKKYTGNFSRGFSIFHFSLMLFLLKKNIPKPFLIIHNIHAPFDYPIFWLSKILNSEYIVEAWDLWPDSFVRSGLISRANVLTRLAYYIEGLFYKNASKIIFTLKGGNKYLEDKGLSVKIDMSKVFYINNGINLKKYKDSVRTKGHHYEKPPNKFVVNYIGSIERINNIDAIIDVAFLLREDKSILFHIYGDGKMRDHLSKCIVEQGLNVVLLDKRIPYSDVPIVCSLADANLLSYESGFGDYGISSGKFFNYLAAGKPILATTKFKFCLIEKYGLGYTCNSSQDLAGAINELKRTLNTPIYRDICRRVHEIATRYDYDRHYDKLIKVINAQI